MLIFGITNGASGEGGRVAGCGGEGWQALGLLCFSPGPGKARSRAHSRRGEEGLEAGRGRWNCGGGARGQAAGLGWSVGGQPGGTGSAEHGCACSALPHTAAFSLPHCLSPMSLFLPYPPPRPTLPKPSLGAPPPPSPHPPRLPCALFLLYLPHIRGPSLSFLCPHLLSLAALSLTGILVPRPGMNQDPLP